ncbi:MAG: hypothetical protein ACFFDT_05260 [Candidatus Hodarchaeota archaeon]
MRNISKPKVEIFTPAGACGCSFSAWIGNVWDKLMKYRDQIEIVSHTSESPRAKELGVGGRSVTINGEETAVFKLEDKIKEILAM